MKSKVAKSRRSPARHCSPWDRFQAAIKVVIRNLGGTRQFLLASGYVPSEWMGCMPGFWVSPNNPSIMWKAKDAIRDHFTRFRWHDRAKAAEKKYKENCRG